MSDEIIEDDALEEMEEKKSPLGLVIMAVGALLFGGAAGGGAYFMTPGADPASADQEEAGDDANYEEEGEEHADEEKTDKKSNDKDGKKKKKNGYGKSNGVKNFKGGSIQIHDELAYFILDPMIISIQPTGNARHLKLSLIIETTADQAEALQSRTYHIKDVLNTYLRSVGGHDFEDPSAMSRLRAQIHRRIAIVAPEITVEQVLITEFVLT